MNAPIGRAAVVGEAGGNGPDGDIECERLNAADEAGTVRTEATYLHGDHPFFGTGQAEAPPMPRHWRRLPGASRVRTGVARPSNPVAGIGPKYRPSILSAAALSRKNSARPRMRQPRQAGNGRPWLSRSSAIATERKSTRMNSSH